MAIVVIASGVYVSFEMKTIDDFYSDLIDRVDGSTTQLARVGRDFMLYGRNAYALDLEITDEGNVLLTGEIADAQKQIHAKIAAIRAKLPEYSSEIDQTNKVIQATFDLCDGPIKEAAATRTPDDIFKAGQKLRQLCDPPLRVAAKAISTLDSNLLKFSAKASDDLTARTNRTIWTTVGGMTVGLVIGVILSIIISGSGTRDAATQVLGASDGLIAQSSHLGKEVEKFISGVNAA